MDELETMRSVLSIFDERSPVLLRRAIEEELGYTLSGPRTGRPGYVASLDTEEGWEAIEERLEQREACVPGGLSGSRAER
jgi:hypothetical protein